MRKQILIFIVAVAVVALVSTIIFYKPSQTQPDAKDDLSRAYFTERVLHQETKNALASFPDGFPIGEGQSTKSFKYIPANSLQQQHTIEYESEKTLAENRTAFLKYLADHGFALTNKTERPDRTFYYASKPDADLSVMLTVEDGKIFVTASYLQQ